MQHISTTLRGLALAAFAAAMAGAVACSGDSTGVAADGSSRIGFMATGSTPANLSVVPETIGGHTLNITAVSLTISRAELKRAHTDSCPGDNDNDDDDDHPRLFASTQSCGELKVGPATVDLPLTGNVVTLPANTIPAGTFREIEVRVSKVEVKGTFRRQGVRRHDPRSREGRNRIRHAARRHRRHAGEHHRECPGQ